MTLPLKNVKQSIPLNSLEKFMLAHESDTISYNSQIMVEFDGDNRRDDLRSAIDIAMREIPLLRSHVEETSFQFKRYFTDRPEIRADDILTLKKEVLTQDAIDQFCQEKFNLLTQLAFRVLLGRLPSGRNVLIFNVHHTLCDGTGQFLILEEIFRIMNGLEVREEAKKAEAFRYRSLWRYMGWKWFLGQLYGNYRPLKKQRQYKMATLIDSPEKNERLVTSIVYSLSDKERDKINENRKKLNVTAAEYLTFCSFKAMDSSLKYRGDMDTPIMIFLPKTLRALLKISYSLHNILTTVLIVGGRNEIYDQSFLSKIKRVISTHGMDSAAKFIFGTLVYSSLLRPNTIRAIYKKLDRDPKSATCSLLVGSFRIPNSYAFPKDWTEVSVWARGTLPKSPGIGVFCIDVEGGCTLTFEYLKALIKVETVEGFKANLIAELTKDI